MDLCLGKSLELGRVGGSGFVVVTCYSYSYNLEAFGVMVLGPAHVIVCVGVETRTIVVLAV